MCACVVFFMCARVRPCFEIFKTRVRSCSCACVWVGGWAGSWGRCRRSTGARWGCGTQTLACESLVGGAGADGVRAFRSQWVDGFPRACLILAGRCRRSTGRCWRRRWRSTRGPTWGPTGRRGGRSWWGAGSRAPSSSTCAAWGHTHTHTHTHTTETVEPHMSCLRPLPLFQGVRARPYVSVDADRMCGQNQHPLANRACAQNLVGRDGERKWSLCP